MRRARIAIVALALGVLGSACMVPDGVVLNGRLPDHLLRTVTPECRMAAAFADPLAAMIHAAQAEGIFLWPETSAFLPPGEPTPPRIESCYRTFEMQQWWRMYWCSKGVCGVAAVPGESVHGWGRAVDFQDQYGELRLGSAAYNWLVAHAAEHGFMHPPGNTEPWHWEAVDPPPTSG